MGYSMPMRVSGGLSSAGFREWLRWFILLFLAVVAALIYFVLSTSPQTNYLTVTIFAVGQGDAALIETPGGTQILIDGGPDNAVIRKLSKRLGFFDRSLDLVIGTHPDHDHIAGLNDVLARYRVATILTTEKNR